MALSRHPRIEADAPAQGRVEGGAKKGANSSQDAEKYGVDRLGALYAISMLLTHFIETPQQAVGPLLRIINRQLPLKSAILIEAAAGRPEVVAWHSPELSESERQEARDRAMKSFALITSSSGPSAPPAPAEAAPVLAERGKHISYPLIMRGRPVFGVLHFEGAARFDEKDVEFVSAISNQVAIALDRHHARLNEIALRKQAQSSQQHAEQEIVARASAEKEVRALNQDLERRVAERTFEFQDTIKELNAFTYSISHDLRAPLRHIHSFAEMLSSSKDEAERAKYIKRILAATEGMDILLANLLSYSRLTLEEVECVPVPLAPVLERIKTAMGEDLLERKATLTVETPLPSVLAQEVLLTQALSNLISNAVKFTAPGVEPRVRVRAELRGNLVRLWVEDNGIGIAPEHRERIFGVFQRLNKLEDYAGTGIGLAIVHRALERMKGLAGVESEPGRGSRFWIELQKAEEKP